MTNLKALNKECYFKAVRSGGKGGQNVNKVSSKVELYFSVADSNILTTEQKVILAEKLQHLISEEGNIRIVCDEDRSQVRNKNLAIEKFDALITKALTPAKKRIRSKTPKAVKEKRIRDKKNKGEIKAHRKKPDWNEGIGD
ncbi:MAG: alternative ribosome rescue aminoacyl-tRNA hydrolase ArfB [Chitinophagales bacterium]